MNTSAPQDLQAYLATRPAGGIIADLFEFTLLSGPVYRFTDFVAPITVAGVTYASGSPRPVRGQIKLSRGISIDSTDVTLQEANGTIITQVAQGFFNRAIYRQKRVHAADNTLQWLGPVTKFFGRVDSISDIGQTSVKITVKSMVTDLDNDFPRDVIMPSCSRVLYDAGCTVNPASYMASSSAVAGSTRNKVIAALAQQAPFYDQGYLTWTSGTMAGVSYMVKTTDAGAVYPAYPFLVAPNVGDTFNIFAGCDKSQATCSSKFNNVLVGFDGAPFVPDPTTTY